MKNSLKTNRKESERVEEKIEKTINVLCEVIEKQKEGSDLHSVAELTNALAALIAAKANMHMSYRMYDRGGTSWKH